MSPIKLLEECGAECGEPLGVERTEDGMAITFILRAVRRTQDDVARFEPFDEGQAVQVGALRERTREQGLPLGDRACLGLAERDGSTLFTSDTAFARVQTNARIELIR